MHGIQACRGGNQAANYQTLPNSKRLRIARHGRASPDIANGGGGRVEEEEVAMKSIATVSLSGDLIEKLEAAASAGFAGVEIFDNDLVSFSGTAADVGRIAAARGLEIVSFQPFRDFEGMPAAKRERVFARAERKFDINRSWVIYHNSQVSEVVTAVIAGLCFDGYECALDAVRRRLCSASAKR
jgi:hypothetical protein